MVKFLVCALFYGDFPQIAQRCALTLRSIRATGKVDMRIGLNEVSRTTREVIDAALPGVDLIEANPQIYKFPMMRRLVHEYRGDATHLMWFDDDTCLHPGTQAVTWLASVAMRAERTQGSLGSTYKQRLTPRQHDWIREQRWYTGRELPDEIVFNTGGWVVVPLALLRRWDWPGPELAHNGGDMVLGALLLQQGLPVEQFRVGLAINADDQLRESAAKRRGYVDPQGSVWHDRNGI
ncbi:MAG TPA: hypothetical protein VHA82_24315 [Ramlibacter sp.]|uniref:hypothetical protein n=1 Tax=Ramlibacter sp. TaxID=1917967 RepID=UPI002D19E9F4|nr:hypothetical protein [Ramlibacter sp.]HVZ46954.1 hypothetical protein [Ramlibacter sp.]